MQRDKEELFHLLQKLAPKSIVESRVEELKNVLDNYKRGINECTERPENIMKLLQR